MKAPPPARFPRRRLRRAGPNGAPVASESHQTRFDLWLVRVGYIAQVGVLVATILGFYFTVIPLYQKAALDELIAQREADLKSAQEGLSRAKREAYEQYRLNFTERLAVQAAAQCSDFRTAISQPGMREPEEARHRKIIQLDVNVTQCLSAAAAAQKGSFVLSAPDEAFLAARLNEIGATLDAKRVAALARIADLPGASERDPALLKPVGEFMAEAYAFQDKTAAALGRPISREKLAERLAYQVRVNQEAIAFAYRQESFAAISNGIRKLNWPSA